MRYNHIFKVFTLLNISICEMLKFEKWQSFSVHENKFYGLCKAMDFLRTLIACLSLSDSHTYRESVCVYNVRSYLMFSMPTAAVIPLPWC